MLRGHLRKIFYKEKGEVTVIMEGKDGAYETTGPEDIMG